jgi:gluconate 5-dehydrogenase
MKNYFDLKGRVAIVTGCSTGLGVQMAKALANQGCNIVAIARRQDKLEEICEQVHLAAYGLNGIVQSCIVTLREVYLAVDVTTPYHVFLHLL